LETNLEEFGDLGETFCHSKQIGNQVIVYDMIPEGRTVELNEKNKELFVELKYSQF
jgi:hypothetical protein